MPTLEEKAGSLYPSRLNSRLGRRARAVGRIHHHKPRVLEVRPHGTFRAFRADRADFPIGERSAEIIFGRLAVCRSAEGKGAESGFVRICRTTVIMKRTVQPPFGSIGLANAHS